jgi:para-aminobenzoate synthetase/4-amino-4-deoxychorismate lyase
VPDPREGVFSTTLVVDGAPVALEAHLARLAASARVLYDAELPADTLPQALERADGHALARLRLTATPNAAAGVCTDVGVEPVERATVLPGAAGAIDLRAIVLDGWPAAHKWVDRCLLDALHDRSRPAIPLLVTPDGSVRETIRGNVFAFGEDVVLRTPPADGSILPGVARGQLIALAHQSGFEVREQPLSLAELADATEAFATNAVRGIEPIRSLGGSTLSGAGELTLVLTAALAAMWSLRR